MINQLLQLRKEHSLKSYHSTKEWSIDYYLQTKQEKPIDKAIIGGFSCQQFSFAFMAGYQAALAHMFPAIAPGELKALCVSEAKGGHPKLIQTLLKDNQITGVKNYVTAGTEADHLLILCNTGEMDKDRPVLKIVHLPRETNGIALSNFELPFMKEVKHGKLVLTNAKVEASQILEGDGYSQYTKPFRSIEDICVGAANQAMLLRQAIENNWEENLRDNLLLNIYNLKNLLKLPPSDRETHILLSAADRSLKSLLPKIDWHIKNHTSDRFKADWKMNIRVISLSKKIKELRLTKARDLIFSVAE